ncbi:hypothetical protein K503DRAFT_822071 [Rhizopogon vinicolor AM-OR11-026]|uniref:ABC transporter domain-containing protein n=1 Tax=Rhizopogon vinicolor AM-OR11-026 TaxID=1314800 RepID=A0A1B7MXI9_9AGAM|nr:hypothetical protein K503DRAFT_822071 [Rhizopogon vinicolor AM-OR11-026]
MNHFIQEFKHKSKNFMTCSTTILKPIEEVHQDSKIDKGNIFIPQGATLFSGTLRDNLGPFNEHEGSECFDVLHHMQMISDSTYQSQHTSLSPSRASTPDDAASSAASMAVTDVDSKTTVTLDTPVSAGGTNFSQGQQQLIAMARTLLRRIDFDTDAKIEATIKEEFTESLLLTVVAHRLRMVIDYDRLIVLGKGEVHVTWWEVCALKGGGGVNSSSSSGLPECLIEHWGDTDGC